MMLRRIALASLLLALAIAAPAFAVPPVLPRETNVIENYMRAIRDNDLTTYSALFAEDAKITIDGEAPMAATAWIDATKKAFVPARRTRFPSVLGGLSYSSGRRRAEFALTVEQQLCTPGIAECFGGFWTEALTVVDGRIVDIKRSGFTHRLTASGEWTFFWE